MCMTTGSRGIWTPQDRAQAPPRRGWNRWDMLEEEKWRRLAELGATPLSTGARPARAWPAGSWRRSSAGRPSGSRVGRRRSGRGWSPRRSPHAARPETSASWTHGGNSYRSDRHRWEVQNTLWLYLSGVLFFRYLYFTWVFFFPSWLFTFILHLDTNILDFLVLTSKHMPITFVFKRYKFYSK